MVYMITEKQFKIFEVFAKNPFAEFTRNIIKEESKEKSNNALALTINSLKEEKVILEKTVGKSGILTLNLNSDKTFYYIALCNENRISENIRYSLELLKKEIEEETLFYSFVVFGSYSIGKQRKDSDLDIAIFIDIEDQRKKSETLRIKRMESLISNAKLKSLIELDVHIIPKSEMVEMLTNKEENLGKQIARKHLALHNHQIFYEIIKEGINHGFRI